MPTPKQDIDLSRYLDIGDVRIDTRSVDRALRLAPDILKEQLLDALDHIRRGFFKALYANTGLKDRRFIATRNVGIGRHLRFYRNPNKGNILDMELGIFTRSKIAALHEKGGTVTAKSGAMAIPIGEARTPTGRLAQEYSTFINYKRTLDLTKIKNLFIRKINDKLFLVKREGENIEPLFILKRSIRIQPRLRFVDTWERMEGYRMNVLNKAVDKALDKA